MNFIVFDLEWNQSNTGLEPDAKKLPFEIIEIGAVKLDGNRRMVGKFSELIRPKVYHQMHYYTKKLIHLDMKQLKGARPFPEVAKRFLQWCGEDCVFCTWGPSDLSELQRNLRYYDMAPLSDKPMPFLDVQKLFSIDKEDRKSRRSLEYAVDFLQIEKDIPFHRAYSDAYYTAKVLMRIEEGVLRNYSFDTFHLPESPKEEVQVLFDIPGQKPYTKYISRAFPDKDHAMSDARVTQTSCYLCKKNVRKKIRWFTVNGKVFHCVSYCPVHGYMKGKIHIRKAEGDRVYAVRTEKFITPEKAEELRERQQQAKLREKKRAAKNQNPQTQNDSAPDGASSGANGSAVCGHAACS